MPSATAALTSNLRVPSSRSLHCFLAAMASPPPALGSRVPPLPAAAGICPAMLPHGRPPGPLHAIDEAATHASTRIHSLPTVRAGEQADGIEATWCNVWRCKAWLLANCWQVWESNACAPRGFEPNRQIRRLVVSVHAVRPGAVGAARSGAKSRRSPQSCLVTAGGLTRGLTTRWLCSGGGNQGLTLCTVAALSARQYETC